MLGLDDDDLAALGLLDVPPPPPPPRAAPPPPLALTALAARTPPSVAGVPPSRWPADAPGAPLATRFVAALPGVAAFDAAAFGVSAAEAAATDPQQRLLLEAVGAALTRASAHGEREFVLERECGGCSGVAFFLWLDASTHPTPTHPAFDPASVSVAVGISYVEYALDVAAEGASTPHTAAAGTLSAAAGRVSFALNLRGPCVAVDTACSSSLVALHVTGTLFVHGSGGESSTTTPTGRGGGVAAGVNLCLRPATASILARASMLAPDGRCKTLDAAGDGYGRGEAVVAAVVEEWRGGGGGGSPPPLALLAATAVAQDGRSASLSAPSGTAQQAVLRQALAVEAGSGGGGGGVFSTPSPASPSSSSFELHGTGTPLDPIELGAALAVLAPVDAGTVLTVTAAKAATAHGEPAAGGVGAAAASRRARGGALAPLPTLRTLNPHVGAAAGAVTRLAAPRAVAPGPGSGVCGVSAFAYQGTNAHTRLAPPSSLAPQTTSIDDASLTLWRRARHWFRPRAHALAARVARASAAGAGFDAPLASPSLAWLAQAVVAGTPLVPVSALCEAAAGAAASLAPQAGAAPGVAIVFAALSAPLPTRGGARLTVWVGGDGFVTVGGGSGVVCLTAVVATVAGGTAPAARSRRRCALVPNLPPPTAACVADLDVRCAPRSAFWAHPALGEAAMHLAAAGGAVAGASVPASVACYAPPAPARAAAAHAAASARRGAAGGALATITACLSTGDDGTPHALAAGAALRAAGAVAPQQPARAAAPAAATVAAPTGPRPSHDAILATVMAAVAAAAGGGGSGGVALAATTPLADVGLDSLGAVELRDSLASALGVPLPATLAYDHPTPGAVAAYIEGVLSGGEGAGAVAPLLPPPTTTTTTAIAVLSVACAAPAPPALVVPARSGATTSDAASAAASLFTGVDAAARVPAARWTPDTAPRRAPRFASFLAQHAASFDAAAFRMNAADAAGADPQARLALECAAGALAGSHAQPATTAAAGVFIGAVFHEHYTSLSTSGEPDTAATLTGTGLHFLVERVCYQLGLMGRASGSTPRARPRWSRRTRPPPPSRGATPPSPWRAAST